MVDILYFHFGLRSFESDMLQVVREKYYATRICMKIEKQKLTNLLSPVAYHLSSNAFQQTDIFGKTLIFIIVIALLRLLTNYFFNIHSYIHTYLYYLTSKFVMFT